MAEVRLSPQLLDALEDPFEVFPLQFALKNIAQVVEAEFQDLWQRYDDVAPRYRDVGLEAGLEAISILIGSGFVAAQAVINRTVARVWDLKQQASSIVPEKSKLDILRIAARPRGSVSDIPGINTLANYFKHNGEWPRPWDDHPNAQAAKALGLAWNNPDNMFIGATTLGFGGRDGLSKLASRLGEWREALASEMRTRAGIPIHDVDSDGTLEPSGPTRPARERGRPW